MNTNEFVRELVSSIWPNLSNTIDTFNGFAEQIDLITDDDYCVDDLEIDDE